MIQKPLSDYDLNATTPKQKQQVQESANLFQNIDNIKEAIKTVSPHGIDISTGLKKSNSVDEEKLKKILDNLGFDEIS